MADKKLSELATESPATLPLDGTELVYLVQDEEEAACTTADIAALAEEGQETNLSYTASTRTLASSTGDDVVLPEATTEAAGLQSAAHKTRIDQLAETGTPMFAGLTITGSAAVSIPHIHGSIAGNFYIHVRNDSGGQLTAGTAVYAANSVGDTDRIRVAACDPTDPTKMPAIGILEATLAANGDGDAVTLGELRPFNTGGYALGDELYVGPGGALVATIPTSGQVQHVGSVARVSANTGTIVIGIGAGMARVGFTGNYDHLSNKPTLGTAAATAATDYAPAAQGVTNGNSHDHNGGDGGQIAYSSLSGTPTIPSPADATPLAPGTAAVGTSTEYAREDHVHPLPAKLDAAVVSDTTGITGADVVTNIVSLTQAEYDAIVSPSATTLYVITS
jgi:hypothetical protein